MSPTADLTLSVPELPVFAGAAIVIVLLLIGVIYATTHGREASLGPKFPYLQIAPKAAAAVPVPPEPPPPALAASVSGLLHRTGLSVLTDVVKGLGPVAAADATTIDAVGRKWFDFLCTSLAVVLAKGDGSRFRVAIWTDDETDPQYLKGLAYHGFDRNDPKLERLTRADTVAGWVVHNREPHYCPNLATCAIWRPRQNPKPSYLSMFAAPLGPGDDPWAVITVDVDVLDGLDEDRRELVQWFGEVATSGAAIIGTSGARRTSISGNA